MNIPKRPLLGLLLACSMPASAEHHPFEGYWGTDQNCTIESASVKYTSIYRQSELNECIYSGSSSMLQQTRPNQWKIQAQCLAPSSEGNSGGSAVRGNRGVLASIVLELDNHRLTERLVMNIGQDNQQDPVVTEYYRCDREDRIPTEDTGATDITPEQARALFERAEQLYQHIEQGNPPVPSEKRQIYRLYRTSYEAGHTQAAVGFGMVTLFGYDKTGEDEPPDWDKAARLLREGVALGDTRAMRGLAMMYWEGNGSIEPDARQIMALYERAHALGDPKATSLLGMILTGQAFSAYFSAVNHEQFLYSAAFDIEAPITSKAINQFNDMVDIPRGLSLLEQAAEGGNLPAWGILAEYYEKKEENLERFIHYLREGAKRGHKGLLQRFSDVIGSVVFPALILVENPPQDGKEQIMQCLNYISSQIETREIAPASDLDRHCPPAWTQNPRDLENAARQIDWR